MIYEFEKKEGFYLVSELEKLRKKKRHDKLIMKCDEKSNVQANYFKRIYLLDGAVNKIIYDAYHYYLQIDGDELTVYLIYGECRIAYCLRTESDWKLISVEFLSPEPMDTPPRRDDAIGRTVSSTLTTILSFCYTPGFSAVFDTSQTAQIQKIFTAVINREFTSNKFESDSQIQAKVTSFLMEHDIRKEFKDKYLSQTLRRF